MVFSSIPAYLDPSNWHHHQQQHQQQNQQGYGFNNNINMPILTNPNPLLPPPPLPPPQHPRSQPPAAQSSPLRPGSMAERARMANIPMPEMALKCPRCESSNTKFCYFNNYSLSQPRHFCKTCRRYWTRGGALRSVPVGGGCRRNNKRSKSSSSSKSASANRSSSPATSSATSSSMLGPPGLSPLRFMSPLHHLTSDFGDHLGLTGYDLGTMASPGADMYRITPPFLGDGSILYGSPFEAAQFSGPVRSKEAVKAEERGAVEMGLMRRFNMGINTVNHDDNQASIIVGGDQNYNWGSGNAWNEHLNSVINNNSSCSNTSAL